jgi:hypothetical protein
VQNLIVRSEHRDVDGPYNSAKVPRLRRGPVEATMSMPELGGYSIPILDHDGSNSSIATARTRHLNAVLERPQGLSRVSKPNTMDALGIGHDIRDRSAPGWYRGSPAFRIFRNLRV